MGGEKYILLEYINVKPKKDLGKGLIWWEKNNKKHIKGRREGQ